MRISLLIKNYVLCLLTLLFNGCIDPFEAKFENFESAIVIEATLTNELKRQTIFLTRAFKFEEEGATPEPNANIRVVGGDETFIFQQADSGVYISEVAFAAGPGIEYQLFIETQDGGSYSSAPTALTSVTKIDDLRAERITEDTDGDGVALLVDSFDPSGNAVNYRYTYEETYKVISPKWNPLDLVGDPLGGCNVIKVPKEREERICYPTDLSNAIVLTNTSDLEEDRVANFMVRFISRDNFIMSHRYSILVRQHVQSNVAYSFYEALSQFSGNESLFSETQPGFLEGNVTSQNENEKVLGFFDVASVTEKRIFFDYTDFYPGEPLPPYIEPCDESTPLIANPGGCVLRPILENGKARYAGDNSSASGNEGPFLIVSRVCGDCTVLGSTEIPDFWIE